MNKMMLIGHLGRDPEVRYMPNGDAVANFSLATTEKWKDKSSGERREETEWHRCTIYGRLAEVAGEYLRKGSKVFLEGKLKSRKYTDKDGVERTVIEVIVREMEMLSTTGQEEGGGGGQQSGQQSATQRQQPPAQRAPAPAPKSSGSGFDDMDDDIPF